VRLSRTLDAELDVSIILPADRAVPSPVPIGGYDEHLAEQAEHWLAEARASVPADYVYDRPHLLGSLRTGPDLFNIGARQPSKDWHLGHLYQPRAYVPNSIMPSYPFLFYIRTPAGGERV
jgi:hypothetical protein